MLSQKAALFFIFFVIVFVDFIKFHRLRSETEIALFNAFSQKSIPVKILELRFTKNK